MFDSLSTTEKFLSVTYTQYDNLSYISLFEITHTRNLNTKLSNHLLQILKYMHSESCLLSKHNIWECKLVWVPAYYTHWFLPSAYQLAWVLYLKSSRFDPRYVVYDNCRHSMCVCVCASFSFSVLLFIKAKQSPWRISQECRRMIPLHHLLPISAKTVRGKQWVRIGLHLNETGGAELWTEDQHHPSFYVIQRVEVFWGRFKY